MANFEIDAYHNAIREYCKDDGDTANFIILRIFQTRSKQW